MARVVYIPIGLFFERKSDGTVLVIQRENEDPTSHTYWEIELTREQWCEVAVGTGCVAAPCPTCREAQAPEG